MKRKSIRTIILFASVVALLGLGTYAFADWGMGWGHRGGGYGPGYGKHRGWGPGYGYGGELSEEQFKQMQTARDEFFKATDKLRQDMYAKQLELRSEIAKENPDPKKAAVLQQQLSELQAQFDQEKLDHMIVMRKINPRMGYGFGGRGRVGGGYGRDGGYGRGFGSGGCWR